jgi:hypothetical protein
MKAMRRIGMLLIVGAVLLTGPAHVQSAPKGGRR